MTEDYPLETLLQMSVLKQELEAEIRRRYPGFPIDTLEGGLLRADSLAFWVRSHIQVRRIVRETMGRAAA